MSALAARSLGSYTTSRIGFARLAPERHIGVFGHFLQTHKFNEPLTWEAIEEALPPWKRGQDGKRNDVRSCLLDLGHLLVARGEMESREIYTKRRTALAPIQQAPEHIRPLLQRYAVWLWERRVVADTVRRHLDTLSSFWSWCDQRGICSPAEVNTAFINNYMLTLYWQWQCSNCQSTVTFDAYDRNAPGACDQCGAIGSCSVGYSGPWSGSLAFHAW